MTPQRRVLFPALALALALGGCAKDPVTQLADEGVRKKVIEALVANPANRQEVIERLMGPPADRTAVIDRVLKDDGAAGELVQRILADDRGKALVVSKVTADDAGAKTFIRMLMLTGVMGASLTQKQADALGMGEAFALGNRRRTMSDLKRIGRLIDDWAKGHEGVYPVCSDGGDVRSCLAKRLPAGTLDALRLADAWGVPFQYRSDREGKEYALLSYATDGQWDGMGKVGPTDGFDCDIVFSKGDFIQWPGSVHKEDIK